MNEALELSSVRSDLERTGWVQANRWYAAMGVDPSLRHEYLREVQMIQFLDPLFHDGWLLPKMETAFLDGKFDEGTEIAQEIQHCMVAHANRDLEWPTIAGPLQAMEESPDIHLKIGDVIGQSDEINGATPLTHNDAALRAWLLTLAGRLDECAEAVIHWSQNGFRDIPEDAGYGLAWTRWAISATATGNRDACRSLLEVADQWESAYVYTGGWHHGPVAYYGAQLASVLGDSETVGHFLKSIVDSEKMNSPLWLARSNVAYAEYLLSRDERDGAREHATKALDAIGTLALHQTAHRAEAVLATAT
jgi:hypothetical protein